MSDFSQIQFYYPSWMLLLCLLLGAIYAFVLYYKDSRFEESSAWLPILLSFLRGSTVFILASLLLMPVLNIIKSTEEIPTLIIAQDISESIKLADNYDSITYTESINRIKQDLSSNYNVVEWNFADAIDMDESRVNENETNISEVFSEAKNQYKGRPLAGVVLATDGLYNLGANPFYEVENLGAPVVALALGDTTEIKDVSVEQVLANQIAFLDDKFIVQIDLAAVGFSGQNVDVSLLEINGRNSKILSKNNVSVDKDDFFSTQEVEVEALKPGIMHLRIIAESSAAEKNKKNNVKDIYIDVIDTKKKILIAAHAPHPDIAALRKLLSHNKNYEITLKYPQNENINVSEYNLVINHNLPTTRRETDFLERLNMNQISQFYIAGAEVDFSQFNQLQNVVDVTFKREVNDVSGTYNKGFNSFDLQDEKPSRFQNYPPVQAPFGDIKLKSGAQTLFNQRVGSVDTQYPLLAFNEYDGKREAIFLAEGLWRWSLYEYLDSEETTFTENLISQTVQYLSIDNVKEQFKVYPEEYLIDENSEMIFYAEIYNDAYQPVHNADVNLFIYNIDGKEFSYKLSSENEIYRRNIGYMNPGEYSYKANATVAGKTFKDSGSFTVKSIDKEALNLVADHSILYNIANKSNGMLFYPHEMSEIPNWLSKQNSSKPIVYTSNVQRPLYSLWWILAILIFLLVLEWFLRRYYGTY